MLRTLPYIFTESGIALLAIVLRTDVFETISIKIMDAFITMRHYLVNDKNIYLSLNNINNKLNHHDSKIK